MQIICKDGTTIQCQEFEAIDSGVLFYQETPRQAAEEDEETADVPAERASGFVPVTELQFVLPDEMVQQPPQGTGQRQTQMPPATQQATGMAQQQQLQHPPGEPQR